MKKNNMIIKCVFLFFLGVNGGLPITLTASLLKALLKDYNISLTNIGILSLITIPYSLKFLWSPVIDILKLPFLSKLLGQKKSWLIFSLILLIASTISLGNIDPSQHIGLFAFTALMISFFSATQDITIDSYRITLLSEKEQGVGVSSAVYGYRVGMTFSGIAGLYLAEIFSWQLSYLIMGIALIPGGIIAIFAPQIADTKQTKDRVKILFTHIEGFLRNQNGLSILILIAFYKLSDAYLGIMTMPFMIEAGYSKIEIAKASKIFGVIATLVGTGIGGLLVLKFSLRSMLFFTEILAMLSNLPFIILNMAEKNLTLLSTINGFENMTSVMSNVAIIAYISKLSKNKYATTYSAILTSIITLGRTVISSSSGWLVETVGWNYFFVISSLLSLPSLIIIYLILFYNKSDATKVNV